jgi:transcriptional regulator with AAA-type ATPase domain
MLAALMLLEASMFLKSPKRAVEAPALHVVSPAPYLRIFTDRSHLHDRDAAEAIQREIPEIRRCEFVALPEHPDSIRVDSEFALTMFVDPSQLDGVADKILAARHAGRMLTLIIAINAAQLVSLGKWLERRANEGHLAGIRLMLAEDAGDVARQLSSRLQQVRESNIIRMPVSTEIENSAYKNFFVFSPELQALVARIRGFAENGIIRACLLGGPGSGKTSLAYYYYLVRERGRFVSINLAAENTGDKAAVKSLLCGHVSGAFPGAGARTGAFAHARDGVTFLDESHGVTGAVMEVLMEALDSGQYLPFGASAKQPLDCALLFASNRSWEHLQNAVNLDEFTRMGASVLQVPELAQREEDMIAVAATMLARLAARCTTWTAPVGLSREAWKTVRTCRWHGNIRGLIRTLESAFVDTTTGNGGSLIQVHEIEQGIERWEPKTHHSHKIYGTTDPG